MRVTREIAPGATGEVVVRAKTATGRSDCRAEVKIDTNDPDQPRITLAFTATLIDVVVSTPSQLRLAEFAGQPLRGEVVLSPGPRLTYEILEVTVVKDHCRVVNIEPIDERRTRVVVEAPAREKPIELRDGLSVRVLASDGEEYTAVFPIAIVHQDEISISPRGAVVFQPARTKTLLEPDAEPIEEIITLTAATSEVRFHVREVELLGLSADVFQVEVRHHDEESAKPQARRAELVLRITRLSPEESVRGRLRIHFEDPDRPPREVRVYALFPSGE